ncbi:MAG: glycine--tRNA ligase subunit beta [Chloroflexi bacterium]|nr:glycine--tRNA ligase subunit beta [Chloroflexota bacterium]
MTHPNTDFQSIIIALQSYWVEWGCTLWQPYYSQVGAGTMNPATFLRVLGPEPWNVAYVEPSVRPDDGRYGENPNRLQQHYQFQVILKPDPGDPQEAYLRSLAAIGIDIHKHDIRFVEDNWASPALGAWGLGWEVWLDGLEITQFTYFQQAGAQLLDPVSVEITYGLDRIAMALQGVQNVGDVQWSPQRTWGDLNVQGEREHSQYYFELADVNRLRQMYDLYEQEAGTALDAGLILPAHDYLLKCSHTFNILDTRGAVGVTERQAYFRRMRRLSSKIAEAYVEDRQRQENPWGDASWENGSADKKTEAKKNGSKISGPTEPADFLLEIGTEELPPNDIRDAIWFLENTFKSNVFDVRQLEYKAYKVFATPRRLSVFVEGLEPSLLAIIGGEKGPPRKACFDQDGNPTKALIGWAEKQNLPLERVMFKEIDGGEYAVSPKTTQEIETISTLAYILPTWIRSLKFEKTMRWNSNLTFSRPIRWVFAMFGEHTVPFDLTESKNPLVRLSSSNKTHGLRLSDQDQTEVKSPADYFTQMEKQGIILDVAERRAAILQQVETLAKKAGGVIPEDNDLLAEVVHLVEAPNAMLGEFEAEFLELPREVLVAVMKRHQRYFPIEKDGKLLNAFIAVGNGDFDLKTVTNGNADVIRARFADAAYFVKRDREQPLESYVEQLKQLTFQKDLGSMWDKTQRIVKLVDPIAGVLGLNKSDLQTAQRAAHLAKADLATKMVVEMTSLQGVMGGHYALDSGEPQPVADAIREHYLPRYAGDAVPASKPSLALGLADRLDTLAGLFAVGLAPTGAKDPFAQRRAAIGLVQSLIAADQEFDLAQGIARAAKLQPVKVSVEVQAQCLNFIVERMRALLLEKGARHDVVNAILAAQGQNPASAAHAVAALSKHVGHKAWPEILDAYARCVRITRDLKESYKLDEKLLVERAEKALYAALQKAEATQREPGSVDDFLKAFMPMIPAISAFFEEVLVMGEDEKLKHNRLALLQRITALATGVADFSKMEGF